MSLAAEIRIRALNRRRALVRTAVGIALAVVLVGGSVWVGVWATRTPPEIAKPGDVDPLPVKKPEPSAGDLPTLIAAVESAVIRIDVQKKEGKAIGSGFIVNRDGVAVTNFHVIVGAQSATAIFHDAQELAVAGVLAMDRERDIAILQLDTPRQLKPLALSSGLPRKGESVVAVGAPKGLSFSVTDGLVSALRLGGELSEFGGPEIGTWIQTSTPISTGNSGGPLINRSAKVVGMNTLVLAHAQNLNFAISSGDIQDVINEISSKTIKPFPEESVSAGPGKPGSPLPGARDDGRGGPGRGAEIAALVEKLERERDSRLKELARIDEALAGQMLSLKKSMLAGDSPGEARDREAIAKLRKEITALRTAPLVRDRLDLSKLAAGQIGNLEGTNIRVMQVMNKERGQCIVRPEDQSGKHGNAIGIGGLDLTNIADGQLITSPGELIFIVGGTETFSLVGGGTSTIFTLGIVPRIRELAASLAADKPKTEGDPEFTLEEQAQLEKIREEADRRKEQIKNEAILAKKKADEAAALTKQEAAARSKLAAADKFLKEGKKTQAIQWLRGVVSKYPDTEAAAEARKLLKPLE